MPDRDGARTAGALDPSALDAATPAAAAARGPDGELALWAVAILVAPREPNGYKLARFVFDLLPEAGALVMVEARREDGGAGLQLPPDSVALELDHSVSDGPEDAASLSIRTATAGFLICMGPGVTR